MPQISLSTMWAKGRFSNMAEFAAKARELGFTHVEANASVSPRGLSELLERSIPISGIHSPCPAALSSKGIPVTNLSLSSLDESEREEAVNFAKKTIDLASAIGAKAAILHMGEVPIDLNLEDELRQLYQQKLTQTEKYNQVKKQLSYQRASKVSPYLKAARKSLKKLSEHSKRQGIMLGLENRFYFHEIPNIDEMEELLNAPCHSELFASSVIASEAKQSHSAQDELHEEYIGYWHDVGHAEVQQRLGFTPHEEWLSRFRDKIIGVHLHDVLGISDHRPPGKGSVNWDMIAKYLPQKAIKVCEIAEWNEEEQIHGVINFLEREGIL